MSEQSDQQNQSASKSIDVPLENPIKREKEEITSINLRKPKPGEMRGMNLQDILQSDVNSIIALVPRISTPVLTESEVENMESEDFAQIGGALYGFFMSSDIKAAISKVTGQTSME